jgi:hypothetical protein
VRRRLLALLTFVLLVPLVLVTAGPGLARALAGAAPHVCRCDAAHTDCVCSICHPERDRDEAEGVGPGIRGVCGDRDVATAATHVAGILPAAPGVVLPALVDRAALDPSSSPRGAPRGAPEPPPPRA